MALASSYLYSSRRKRGYLYSAGIVQSCIRYSNLTDQIIGQPLLVFTTRILSYIFTLWTETGPINPEGTSGEEE